MADKTTESVEMALADKWHIEPLPIHGFRVVDQTGREIVHDVYDEEIAEQIARDHNAQNEGAKK